MKQEKKYVTEEQWKEISQSTPKNKIENFPNELVKNVDGVRYNIVPKNSAVTMELLTAEGKSWFLQKPVDADVVKMHYSEGHFPTDLVCGVEFRTYSENTELAKEHGFVASNGNSGTASECFLLSHVDKVIETLEKNNFNVVNSLNQKQNTAMGQKQLRRQILGVPLTPEQQVKYDSGDAIYLENMRNSKSELFNSFVYKDENGKMKFSKHDPKELEQAKERRRSFGGVPFTPTQVLNYEKGATIFLEGVQKDGESIKRDVFVTKLPNNEIKVVEKKPSLDISEIKQIPIKGFLSQHGFEPQTVKKEGAELWYNSPLREEKTPSFKVDTRKNTFKDFGGEGHGGSIIDLAMVMYGTDLKGAMVALSEQVGMHTPVKKFFTLKNEVEPPQKKTTITKIDELKHPALLQYLDERCIDIEVARKFCKEIHYKNEDSNKEYFAIGFQNDSGDWELRNKYYKGCTGKDITLIESAWNKDEEKVGNRNCYVFEGFMDALSVLSERKNKNNIRDDNGYLLAAYDIIILNSTNLLNERNTSLIEKVWEYDFACAYFDNDTAGKQATETLAKVCKERNMSFLDQSYLYAGLNDYNEFRVANQKSKNNQQKPPVPTQEVSPSKPKHKPKTTGVRM